MNFAVHSNSFYDVVVIPVDFISITADGVILWLEKR